MTIIYADSDALAAWAGASAPSNASVLLRSASLLVRQATLPAMYAADDDGLPTDADLLQAMSDATCAHAAALWAAGINPLSADGDIETIKASGIGTGRVEFAGADASANNRFSLLTQLCQESLRILHGAGALNTPPLLYRG